MGAGQIGGIATLVDIDFENAAGFTGVKADDLEAQYVVHYLSHSMLFCTGVLIEAHVVLTVAGCVLGEKNKFDVVAGSHRFLQSTGITRKVNHLCVHKAYNDSDRWEECTAHNLALLVLERQFSFSTRERGADYVVNRVRYGLKNRNENGKNDCAYYGWGSRRNGFLIPLLIDLYRVPVHILDHSKCLAMFNYNKKYLCIQEQQCMSEKFGALCPDDIGSVIVCNGFVQGMMISRLVDRPCGVGFLDLSKYGKFLTCGVDESRDIFEHEEQALHDLGPVAEVTNKMRASVSTNTTTTAA